MSEGSPSKGLFVQTGLYVQTQESSGAESVRGRDADGRDTREKFDESGVLNVSREKFWCLGFHDEGPFVRAFGQAGGTPRSVTSRAPSDPSQT